MLARWTPAFARALLCHLRKDGDWQGQLGVSPQPAGGVEGGRREHGGAAAAAASWERTLSP